MNMKKIYIRTHAYNAEKTLRRAVDSVLNQTYVNFSYYLCDNGSTDGGATRKIIEEYAKSDNRIIPFYNEFNRNWKGNEDYLDLPHHINKDDYFCELDADDEYLPAFFEEMLFLIELHGLDIACCGNDAFSAEKEDQLISRRLLTETLIVERERVVELFPIVYEFMRTCWGKLYKGSTLNNFITRYDQYANYPIAYGGDTFNNVRVFKKANRIGILARSLHKYYVSSKSDSYSMHPQRVKCDQILFEEAIEYLKSFGEVSPGNLDFVFTAYLRALRNTLQVLLNADISVLEKINGLNEICTCEYTKQLASKKNLGFHTGDFQGWRAFRKEIFDSVVKWILGLKGVQADQVEKLCNIGEFASAVAGNPGGWIAFRKNKVDFLQKNGDLEIANLQLLELEEFYQMMRKFWRLGEN